MESQQVKSIMKPYTQGISLKIAAKPEDKLTDAVQRMLTYNASRMVVVRKNKPIGVITLEDALRKLGLGEG